MPFNTFAVNHADGTLRNLGDNYLKASRVAPNPAYDRWAPELAKMGWLNESTGGNPDQYGFASMVPHGDKWIIRSCAELICVGPRYKGKAGDDMALGKTIASSSDVGLLKKYLADSNAFYRYSAVTAAAATPDLTQQLATELQQLVTGDNYPEISGLALNAIMTADPAAPILATIVGRLKEKDCNPREVRQIVDTLVHSGPETTKLLITVGTPQRLGHKGLQVIYPALRRSAIDHPELFCETIPPLYGKYVDHARPGLIDLMSLGGERSKAALPFLTENAIGGWKVQLRALQSLKRMGDKPFGEAAPKVAASISEAFTKKAGEEGKNHLQTCGNRSPN